MGPRLAEQFERLGVQTVGELIRHYPYRYDDLRDIAPIGSLAMLAPAPSANGEVNVVGTVRQFKHVRLRGRVRSKSTAIIEDATGDLTAVWFGRWYLGGQVQPGTRLFLRGRIERTLGGPQMLVSRHRVLNPNETYRGELVPVYPQTAGLTSARIGSLVQRVLPGALAAQAELDPLPATINRKHKFRDARWALGAIHRPRTPEEAHEARRRLVYEEFFLLAAAAGARKAALRTETAPDFSRLTDAAAREAVRQESRAIMPFTLTGAQERVIDEITADMLRGAPMNRLLQGDVGSGKTAVAAAAAVLATRAGAQTAFMAPTEVLALQQFGKLQALLSKAGVQIALLIGNLKRSTRATILQQLARGEVSLVVGTHALLTEDVAFANLGLVVIDEQHRFGVLQRAALRAKAQGHTPHTLIMTATPIPRTLAQTLYADLDVSVLDELPPGRRPVKTYVRTPQKKAEIFEFVRDKVAQGLQAYVVCPAIDDTERAIHTAVKQAEELRTTIFRDLRVALLHGRMSTHVKEQTMRLFADGFVQVLISTTVVEVGVDVPNAAIMVVLDAQSFGLSQLHQLRGRVGRGTATSYCILVAAGGAEESHRLAVLEQTNDGFAIADADMKLRGTGDIAGTRQHGVADLRLANLIADYPLFIEAKRDADEVLARDPTLASPESAGLRRSLAEHEQGAGLRVTS